MKKRIITLITAMIIIFSTFSVACDKEKTSTSSSNLHASSSSSAGREILEPVETEEISYTDLSKTLTETEQTEVDSLFYKNQLTGNGADPSCIYDEESGYYYMYSTLLISKKSKDLMNWESENKNIFETAEDTWITNHIGYRWAPAVIYDEDLDKYLMFFTTSVKADYYERNAIPSGMEEGNSFCICLAVSDSPDGPFKQWTGTVNGGTYASGATFSSYEVTGIDTYINFDRMKNANPLYYDYEGFIKVIDVEPFIDPATGDKYLYVCRDVNNDPKANEIYGNSSVIVIKMIDWFTPDYSTVKQVTKCDYLTVDALESLGNEGSVNEGPYVVYNEQNQKYYLTYSCNAYWDKTYQVRQAVADSPMGPFRKIAVEKGGAVVASQPTWPHRAGTGHHTFVRVNGDLYIVYHMHTHPSKAEFDGYRGIAIDKISWYTNEDGDVVMTSNGPSMGYVLSSDNQQGYVNVANKATVYAYDGYGQQIESKNLVYVNDGIIKTMTTDGKGEFGLDYKDDPTFCLDFSSPVTVKGIQVFNSYSIKTAFDYVKDITIYYKDNNVLKSKKLVDISFDWETYCTNNLNSDSKKVYAPGNCAGAIFDEISNVVSISVHLYPQVKDKIYNLKSEVLGTAVSEIVVIGKTQ